MNAIQLELNDQGRGSFLIKDGEERLAEMVISIHKGNLTVFHTEVSDKLRGKGIAAQLLSTMVQHARDHKLKVIALCPYVHTEFERHTDQYADIWNRDWHHAK